MTRDNRLIALSLLLWGFGDGLFLYIQPLYLRELGANPVAIGSILSLAGVASVISHIPAGYLADRFGRKQLLVWGWGLGVLTALVMYLANTIEVFVIGLVTYTFTGFVIAPINAYVTEARGAQSIQRAVTLVSAGFWSGTIISPALGGLIAREFGLRQVYGVAVIAFTLSTFVLLFLTPQPLVPPAPGQTRYGLLFRNWRFLSFLALMFVALSAMELGVPLAPNFISEVRGFNVDRIGLLGSINALGVVLLNLVLGQRTPRRGFMTGQILMALYLGLLLFAPGFGWLAAAYFFRAGWNLSRNMATAQVGRVVAKSEMALAYGMIETMTALTLALAPVVAGVLYQRSPALPFQTSLGLIAVTLPLVWIFAPRRDAHTPIREPVSAVDIQQIGD